jgi:hypothetical protein
MSRPKRRNSKNNNRKQRSQGGGDPFWGDGSYSPKTAERIHPTPDPAALPRSLGDPPLTRDTAAELHLAAVYEEAVRYATALAAVNGLLGDVDVVDAPPPA